MHSKNRLNNLPVRSTFSILYNECRTIVNLICMTYEPCTFEITFCERGLIVFPPAQVLTPVGCLIIFISHWTLSLFICLFFPCSSVFVCFLDLPSTGCPEGEFSQLYIVEKLWKTSPNFAHIEKFSWCCPFYQQTQAK